MNLEDQINNLLKENYNGKIKQLIEKLRENIVFLSPLSSKFVEVNDGYFKENFYYVDNFWNKHERPDLVKSWIYDNSWLDEIKPYWSMENYKGELKTEILEYIKNFINDLDSDNISQIYFERIFKTGLYEQETILENIKILLDKKEDIQTFKRKFNLIRDWIEINHDYRNNN